MGKEKVKKPFYKKWWVWVIAIIVIAIANGGDDDATKTVSSTDDTKVESKETTAPAKEEPKKEEPKAEEPKGVTISSGQLTVGADVKPGLYKSDDTSYWARLKGFSGELDDILANGNSTGGSTYVEIKATDKGFESQGGDWTLIDENYKPEIQSSFGDGMYMVGKDIAPGTYKNDGSASMGYWARLSNFSGDLSSIIANNNVDGQATIEISPSDKGFVSTGMGTWTKVN